MNVITKHITECGLNSSTRGIAVIEKIRNWLQARWKILQEIRKGMIAEPANVPKGNANYQYRSDEDKRDDYR